MKSALVVGMNKTGTTIVASVIWQSIPGAHLDMGPSTVSFFDLKCPRVKAPHVVKIVYEHWQQMPFLLTGVLPLGRYLWDLMRQRRRASDSDWVFANPLTGNRIIDPHRQIVNVVAKSGVAFSPHDLRRTFASIVSRLGDRLSYYTTKRLLNHRTSDVTQGYVQFDIEQLRLAIQAVEDFVLQKVAPDRRGQPKR